MNWLRYGAGAPQSGRGAVATADLAYYRVADAAAEGTGGPLQPALSATTATYALQATPPLKRKSRPFSRAPPSPPPERTVAPLLAALLAPPPPAPADAGAPACAAPLAALLAAGPIPPDQLSQTAVFASWGEQPLRGTALHAAALAIAHTADAAAAAPLLPQLLEAGADVDAGLVAEGAPQHWLNGATPLHLVALLAMHHGTAAQAALATLVKAGANRERTLCGATALHLAAASMDALVPRDAADTVHALSAAGGIHRRAGPRCPPLALATATPLEAACASPQQGASAIDALVLEGARLDGAEGARVLLACLACGHRRKARLLLQRQACVTAEVAMHWPSMVEKCAAPRAWPCGLLPHDAADPAALHFSPLHWLALASSRAIPTPLSTSQLNQLFQDALFCVPEGSKLPAMPRLPRGALGADATPCDLAAYILRHCPLHFAVIASSRDVRLDGVSEAAPGGRTVTRNSIALLMRRAPRDSAKNICSAVHVLLDGKVSPMRPDSESGDTALHSLVPGLDMLYTLLKLAGADVAARNSAGETALHCAVARGDLNLTRMLLLDACDVNAQRGDGRTPAHLAGAHADAETRLALVRSLVKSNASLALADAAGELPVDVARRAPEPAAVVEYLEKQAQVRSHIAARNGATPPTSQASVLTSAGSAAAAAPLKGADADTPPRKDAGEAAATTSDRSLISAGKWNAGGPLPSSLAEGDAPSSASSAAAHGSGSGLPVRAAAAGDAAMPSGGAALDGAALLAARGDGGAGQASSHVQRLWPDEEGASGVSAAAGSPEVEGANPLSAPRAEAANPLAAEDAPSPPAAAAPPATEASVPDLHGGGDESARAKVGAGLSGSNLFEAGAHSPAGPPQAREAAAPPKPSRAPPSSAAATNLPTPPPRARYSAGAAPTSIPRTRSGRSAAPAAGAGRRSASTHAGARGGGDKAAVTPRSPMVSGPRSLSRIGVKATTPRTTFKREPLPSPAAARPPSGGAPSGRRAAAAPSDHDAAIPTAAGAPQRAPRPLSLPVVTLSADPPAGPAVDPLAPALSRGPSGLPPPPQPSTSPRAAPATSPAGGFGLLRTDLSLGRRASVSSTASATKSSLQTLPNVAGVSRGAEIIRRVLDAGSLGYLHAEIGQQRFEALVFEELPKRQTLLHCLSDEQEQLVRPLLALGVRINAVDADGNSAMHTAASSGNAAVLRMLIMCSADPHIVNKRGQDALLCAVRSKTNTMGVVRTLMKFGMRADVTDASGKTALDVAVQRAKGYAQDPLVVYMTRTSRVQRLQSQGLQRRRQESKSGSGAHASEA